MSAGLWLLFCTSLRTFGFGVELRWRARGLWRVNPAQRERSNQCMRQSLEHSEETVGDVPQVCQHKTRAQKELGIRLGRSASQVYCRVATSISILL